jgi:hypothetical protein
VSKQQIKLQKLLGEEPGIKRKDFNQNEKIVVDLIQHFLMSNTKLMHFDLTQCGLTSDMLLEITKAVKYTQSLVGIHLSGNPGLTPDVREKIVNRLAATLD